MGWGSFKESAISSFLEYDTPVVIHIKNPTVGIVNRLVQLLIIFYIIGYAIIYQKGYQEYDDATSAIATKVKGLTFDPLSKFQYSWDVADYVIPPQETNALFIATGIIPTLLQTHANCGENPFVKNSGCKNDSDCEYRKGKVLVNGGGPLTGKCVSSTIPGKQDVCEMYGWCNVEDDQEMHIRNFTNTGKFTVFIKNFIEFPIFGVKRRNILTWYKNDSELSACRWNKSHERNKYCPIFILEDMTREVGVEWNTLVKSGGIMKVIIDWACNLDYDLDDCLPSYSFSRLDKGNYTSSVGFNFRYADHFFKTDQNGTDRLYRNLYKVYGVHFLIEVRGRAGRFSVVPLILNIGSGIALLGLSSVLCDILMIHVLKSREFYKGKKFLHVHEDGSPEPKTEPDATKDEENGHANKVLVDDDGRTPLTADDNNKS